MSDWFMRVRMIGPDGVEHTSQAVAGYTGDPNPGENTLQLCADFEPPGTYTLTSEGNFRANGSGATTNFAPVVEGTFQVVGSAKSKVSLNAKRKGTKAKAKAKVKAKAKAKVSVSTGGGFGPFSGGGKVLFQKKVGKKWKKVDSATADAAGVAKGKFRARKGTVIRAKFAGAGTVIVGSGSLPIPAATSKAIRIR